MTTAKDIEAKLLAIKPYLREAFGVDRIGYFGSFARGDYREDSDLDVLVRLSGRAGWQFFDLKTYLEHIVGRKVDLVTEGSIREKWRKDILEQTHFIMGEKDYLAYVEDMITAIDKIFRYLRAVTSLEDFRKNEMVVDAVTRNYEIIGEAANKVPPAIREKYPDLPWRQMYGLRNFAAHEYHLIDPKILWEIAADHLPENKAKLEKLLEVERGKA